MTTLSAATLPILARSLAVPSYERTSLTAGVVHVGVGGFHRAHQAMYLDRLLATGVTDWAVVGVGVLPDDVRMRDALGGQDHLYTLVEKHPDGGRVARVVGSIVEVLWAPEDVEAVVERMALATTRVVSLTITEGGYGLDPVTGGFAPTPEMLQDLAGSGPLSTVFAIITDALARRRARGIGPFTIMSCDNIQGNGAVARRAFTSFARLRDEDLGTWIEENVSFPSSMVDRITPATTDADRAAVAESFGVEDRWPVVCEPFVQWVLEDDFCAGRPELERVGVQLVPDVHPYELMKLRLLNAGHQALAYLGFLLGYDYVHEAARDPHLVALLRRYWAEEARATLAPVPGVDLDAYTETLLERFGNPHVADTLTRICADTSDRIPVFLLPVVRDNLAAGGSVHLAALVVASWTRYAEGIDEQGSPITVIDPLRADLMPAAARHVDDPLAFLRVRAVFGDLVDDARFTAPYAAALTSLRTHGSRATLASLLPR